MEYLKRQLSGGQEEEPLLQSDPKKRYVPKRYYTGADDLNTITETEEDKSSSGGGGSKRSSWRFQRQASDDWYHKLGISSCAAVTFASIISMVALAGVMVTLPMYVTAMTRAGSDAYTAVLLADMWVPVVHITVLGGARLMLPSHTRLMPKVPLVYLAGVGLLLGVGLVLLTQTNPPWRTHSVLHPALLTAVLPVAVGLTRLIQDQHGGWLYLTIVAQLVGMLISIFPLLFEFARGEDFAQLPWYYTLVYLLGWCIIACTFVVITRLVTRHRDHALTVLTWTHGFTFACVALLFWINVLPGLGMARDFTTFTEHFSRGLRCFYLVFPECSSGVTPRAAVLIISLCSVTSSILLLTVFPKGLLYLASVLAVVIPITTVYWTLFQDWPSFRFRPSYDDSSTIFVISGLAIIVIGLLSFIYVHLSYFRPRHLSGSRVRRYSTPLHIGRQQLFPSLQRRRRSTYAAGEGLTPATPPSLPAHRTLRKSNSGPNLSLLSAASAAAASRGYASFSSRMTSPMPVPRAAGNRGMPRPKSSPCLMSM